MHAGVQGGQGDGPFCHLHRRDREGNDTLQHNSVSFCHLSEDVLTCQLFVRNFEMNGTAVGVKAA